jgi:hypothetical protein
VYGPQYDELKIQFLHVLHNIRATCTSPWVVGGDFNLIYRVHDKSLWVGDSLGLMRGWHQLLVRLDRVFVSMDWEQLFYSVSCRALLQTSPITSLYFWVCRSSPWGKEDSTSKASSPNLIVFLEEVKNSWEQPMEAACPLHRLADKFKRLARNLQHWS